MGCDGGSIPRRNELVKTKKKEEVADSHSQKQAEWFTCALSKLPLTQPVVSCPLGKLYNKQAILEFLLKNTTFGDGDKICGYINSIKLVTTLNLTPNPAYRSSSSDYHHSNITSISNNTAILATTNDKAMVAQFICPVSMKEINGTTRFSYLSSCGCCFAEQALKEVQSKSCLNCGKKYKPDDIIPLNSRDDQELEKLNEKMIKLKNDLAIAEAARKAEKKAKKALKNRKEGALFDDDNKVAVVLGEEKGNNNKTNGGVAKVSASSDNSVSDREWLQRVPEKEHHEMKKKRIKKSDDDHDSSSSTHDKPHPLDKNKKKKSKKSNPSSIKGPSTTVHIPEFKSVYEDNKRLKHQSEAIKSLYTSKKDGEAKITNGLFSGTFNRYASF